MPAPVVRWAEQNQAKIMNYQKKYDSALDSL